MNTSSSSESSESDNAPSSPVVKRATVMKPKPPLFIVQPGYVPRIPERLSSDVCLSPLGSTINVSDGCVIVQSRPNVPTLDAGTSLFLKGGEPLGEIYETFGPVATPLYVIVLPNSPCLTKTNTGLKSQSHHVNQPEKVEDVPASQSSSMEFDRVLSSSTANLEGNVEQTSSCIDDAEAPSATSQLGVMLSEKPPTDSMPSNADEVKVSVPVVHPGDLVYFVKDDPELTIPVFYSQLVQMKGSDASWVNDTEPPPEELDFSDDEQERQHKRNLRSKRRNPAADNNTSVTSNKQHSGNRLIHGSKPRLRCGKPFISTGPSTGGATGASYRQSSQMSYRMSFRESEWNAQRMPPNWHMCELPPATFPYQPVEIGVGERPAESSYGAVLTPGNEYGMPVFNRGRIVDDRGFRDAPMHSHSFYTRETNCLNSDCATFNSLESYQPSYSESPHAAPEPYRPAETLNRSSLHCNSSYFGRRPSVSPVHSWPSPSTVGCPNAATYDRFSRPPLCQDHPFRMMSPRVVPNPMNLTVPIHPVNAPLHAPSPNTFR